MPTNSKCPYHIVVELEAHKEADYLTKINKIATVRQHQRPSFFANMFSNFFCGFNNHNVEDDMLDYATSFYSHKTLNEIIDDEETNGVFGKVKNKCYASLIVKSGDPMRQDIFASEVMRIFLNIFDEEGLDIFLHPLEIFSNGSGGVIKIISNSISLDGLKKRYQDIDTIKNYFDIYYDSAEAWKTACGKFCKSLAGYSLLSYFLQTKDRHNGNILLDSEGHIIHIDFEYMLSHSPGNMNFENAPFKLTTEYIDLLFGDNFVMFSMLFIEGFKAIRKNWQLVVGFIYMNSFVNSDMLCFRNCDSLVDELKARMLLNIPENAIDDEIENIVTMSRESWRTSLYDRYQKVCVGIR